MLSTRNAAIIACAGSGKTTRLVDQALASSGQRIALVTYTNANAREILFRFGTRNSGVPPGIEVMTWFTFLLRHGARPYQRAMITERRIESIFFVNEGSARYSKESDVARHYFAGNGHIYSDKVAKFVVRCEERSGRAVTERLCGIFSEVYFDEFQDLTGWDLEVVRMLLDSSIGVTFVGDPRQHIYGTHPDRKNSQFAGHRVVDLVSAWQRKGLCSVETLSMSHRCTGEICRFVNLLWPGMEPMTSRNERTTGHDGVFLVRPNDVPKYLERFHPAVLRNSRRSSSYGPEPINFGAAKGLEFERILIVPTRPIASYLASGSLSAVEDGRDRLHVAVTRARQSVAFAFDGTSPIVTRRWEP